MMRHRPVLATTLLALAALLAACGGGSSSASTTKSTTKSTTSTSSSDQTAASKKFSDCMKTHGVDVPNRPRTPDSTRPSTPDSGQRSGGQGPGGGAFANPDPKTQAALDTCRKLLPNGGSGGFGFRNNPQLVQCLKGYGVTVPQGGDISQLDRTDPNVQQALQQCRSQFGSTSTTATGA